MSGRAGSGPILRAAGHVRLNAEPPPDIAKSSFD